MPYVLHAVLFNCCCQCLYLLCTVQVAVKRLSTSNAPASAESLFLKEIQSLQLASSICHRACRMLGLCKLDGDACIVMTLYPKSAAQRLEDLQGQRAAAHICSCCCALYQAYMAMHGTHLERDWTDRKQKFKHTSKNATFSSFFCLSYRPNCYFVGGVLTTN